MTRTAVFVATVAASSLATVLHLDAAPPPASAASVPLCPGLTIVTAVNQSDGDYESIKTVESITDSGVRLRYSVERLVDDLFSTEPPKLTTFTLFRTVRQVDLTSATLYEQQFSTELPETIPETTAIGTSTAVLNALKTKGEARIGIFIAYSQKQPSLDRNVHPNVYDNQMVATITRVGATPVMMPVILNDAEVTLPAIQAQGDFFGDKTEFFFLDDPANPMTLKFRFGIDANKVDPTLAKLRGIPLPASADRDVLQVVKITARCAAAPPQPGGRPGGGGGAAGIGTGAGAEAGGGAGTGQGSGAAEGTAASLEQALAHSGHVDVYSIYFSFNSDAIRDESQPTLNAIAEVLRRHPDWKLSVTGHTDNIGGPQYNLDLSRRRAASVKTALVGKYGVAAGRLMTSGAGESQPKDTNDTLEGRARNRRVELVKS
jgi:outer membrane protein OmpA-like peptidoglycan-associated protein